VTPRLRRYGARPESFSVTEELFPAE